MTHTISPLPHCYISRKSSSHAWLRSLTAAAMLQVAFPLSADTVSLYSPPLKLAMNLSPTTQANDSMQTRLVDALETMLGEHPDVLRARAALDSAGHDISSARGARWPSFKVGTSGGNAELRNGRENYNTINAEVRMSLIDGGAIGAGIRSAESQEAAQTSVLFGTRQNVLLEALTAMQELSRLESKSAIAAESARLIGQLARIEERRAELGAVGRNDLRQAASRQAGALAQQYALDSQRMDALARFTRYFRFTPTQGSLPLLKVPVQWLATSESAAIQASEANSPELQEAAQQIAKAEAEIERSKAQRFPTLAAVVTHTRDPKGVLYTEGTRYGLELNWNFGNGFELRDRILKAINELQSQQAQQESVRQQIQETASAAWGRAQAGLLREKQLGDAVREARSAFEGRKRLLEVGRGSLAQVLDAQLDMQRLMLDEADAIHDQRINELRLSRITGQLLPEQRPERWLAQLFAPQGSASQHQPAQPMPDGLPFAPQIPGERPAPHTAVALAQARSTQFMSARPNASATATASANALATIQAHWQLRMDRHLEAPANPAPVTQTAQW